MMSFIQSRFPLLATAKHPHNKTGASKNFQIGHITPLNILPELHRSIQMNLSIFKSALHVLLGQEWHSARYANLKVILV